MGWGISWADEDWEFVARLFEWVFKNWDEIKPQLRVKGFPTLNMLCTKSIFNRVFKWHRDGIPVVKPVDVDGVGKRADEDDIAGAKEVGW